MKALSSMLNFMRVRSTASELIDAEVEDKKLLYDSFRDIELVNKHFGGIAPVRDTVLKLRPQTMLDIGCGFADLPRAISVAARKKKIELHITCLDAHPEILKLAKQRSAHFKELSFILARGEDLPFPSEHFDTACCTLALHHFPPDSAVALLREMRRVTRRPIVADLRRCYGGLIGAYAFSRLLSQNVLTRHDAPLSVRRAYKPHEALQLAREAGWHKPAVRKTPFYRMLMTDEG